MSVTRYGFPKLLYWFANVKAHLTLDVVREVLAAYCDIAYADLRRMVGGVIAEASNCVDCTGSQRKYWPTFSICSGDVPPVCFETTDTHLYTKVVAQLRVLKVEHSVTKEIEETNECHASCGCKIVVTKYTVDIR